MGVNFYIGINRENYFKILKLACAEAFFGSVDSRLHVLSHDLRSLNSATMKGLCFKKEYKEKFL